MIPRRPLGNTGLQVSALGYGGASIGFADPAREAEFVPLLLRALDLGIIFFDTAPDYRHSEELLGKALRGRRQGVIVATKCGRVQTLSGGGWQVREDWSEEGTLRMVEDSLRRLDTDYLDIVQLHSPPLWALDNGDALRGLQRAKREGKVRHIGVSADGAEARRAVDLGAFETLQVSYSILQQDPGKSLLPTVVQRGMGIIVKQPVANGIADLRERPGHPDWSCKWDLAQRMDWPGLGAPDDVPSARLDLALRWVLTEPSVCTAIVGTTRIEHLARNAHVAAEPPLDRESFERIRQAYEAASIQEV